MIKSQRSNHSVNNVLCMSWSDLRQCCRAGPKTGPPGPGGPRFLGRKEGGPAPRGPRFLEGNGGGGPPRGPHFLEGDGGRPPRGPHFLEGRGAAGRDGTVGSALLERENGWDGPLLSADGERTVGQSGFPTPSSRTKQTKSHEVHPSFEKNRACGAFKF